MPRLLDRAPVPPQPSELVVRGERVRVRANQIIVWLTVTSVRADVPSPAAAPFPAILDTGHTHTFSIQERHLIEWAGLRPEALPVGGAVRERGLRLVLRKARLWCYPLAPRSQSHIAERPPLALAALRGIAVYPSAQGFPRLPLLGLRALVENGLVLTVNGGRREATLRTAFRWWPLAGR